MISKEKFLAIKEKYGKTSSFALWFNDPKGSMKPSKQSWNMSLFVEPNLSKMLNDIRTDIIFVGLNVSQVPVSMDPNYKEEAFLNFHSGKCDYRLMKAFFELPDFYGAYMTDIYKYFTNKKASAVASYFKKHPDEEKTQFDVFQKEINFVCDNEKPLFIISGKNTKEAFERFNEGKNYKYIVIDHYSSNGGSTKRIINALRKK